MTTNKSNDNASSTAKGILMAAVILGGGYMLFNVAAWAGVFGKDCDDFCQRNEEIRRGIESLKNSQ